MASTRPPEMTEKNPFFGTHSVSHSPRQCNMMLHFDNIQFLGESSEKRFSKLEVVSCLGFSFANCWVVWICAAAAVCAAGWLQRLQSVGPFLN